MAWILGTANDKEIEELNTIGVEDLIILTKEQTEGVFKSVYGSEGFDSEDYGKEEHWVIYWLDCNVTDLVAVD